jgi:hypothetical protein
VSSRRRDLDIATDHACAFPDGDEAQAPLDAISLISNPTPGSAMVNWSTPDRSMSATCA